MDPTSRALLNSVGLLIVSSIMTFVAARYWWQRNAAVANTKAIADDHQRVLGRLTELEMKLALVNQAVIPISTAFQAILIKELTHYHTPEMDALLVKIGPPNTLTEGEQERLSELLIERTKDMGPLISDAERDAAAMLPMIIKRALAEAETLHTAESMKLKLINVAAVIGVPITVEEKIRSTDTALLEKIEQNTEVSAQALSILNQRTAAKLATTALKRRADDKP